MKKIMIIAIGAGLALSLSGISMAQTNATNNPFQSNAISTHTQSLAYKKDMKKSNCKCKKDGKCKVVKSGKTGTEKGKKEVTD